MGLKEKRAVAQFKEEVYPGLVEKISGLIGREVDFEIDWDQLAWDNSDINYAHDCQKIFFEPVIKAFEAICIDDMGKSALSDVLTKINFKCSGDKYDSAAIQYSDGVITIDHIWANVNDLKLRTDKLLKLLEAAL